MQAPKEEGTSIDWQIYSGDEDQVYTNGDAKNEPSPCMPLGHRSLALIHAHPLQQQDPANGSRSDERLVWE